MPEMITMPKLGFDMAEGTLVRWVKQIGDEVTRGDILVEVETDKATVEVEAFNEGILRGTFVDAGAIVPVGALIGVLGSLEEEIDLDALKAQAAAAAGEEDDDEPGAAQTPTSPPSVPAPSQVAPPAAGSSDGMLRVSPVAQRMAMENGIDLRQVRGSGPQGRIVKRDIEAYLAAPAPAPAAAPATFAPVSVAREDTVVELSRLRQAIGRRMTESKTTLPHFYVTNEVDMAAVMTLRKQLNAALEEQGAKLSVNDFIVKAAALALREFPNLNAVMQGAQLVRRGHIHIGVAVAVEGGLLTIVCRDADTKSLAQISTEVREMATRARSGKVRPDDIEGSTFTTSNLGMYEVDHFIAIINPPEPAILATGSVRQVPVIAGDQVVPGARMKATIAADHRVTDGAEAARFMQAFKRNLEQPVRLML